MKNRILIFTVFFISQIVLGQTVSITGKFEDVKDGTNVTFNAPFDGEPSHFVFANDFCPIKNNSFQKSIVLNSTGIIELGVMEKGSFGATLICDKGDSVRFNLTPIKNGKSKLQFEGSNAAGLDFINSGDFASRKFAYAMQQIFSETETSDGVIEKLNQMKNKTFAVLDSLQGQNKISKSFSDYTKNYYETEMVMLSYMYLDDFLGNKYESPRKLSDQEVKLTIQKVDQAFDVFDKRYNAIKTDDQCHNLINKCTFIEAGVLKAEKQDYGLWKENALLKYNFAPKELQEFLAYYEIRKADFNKELYSNYVKKMPKGIYVQPLKQKFEKVQELEKLPANTLAVYENELKVIDHKGYNSVEELLSQKFKGKAVFVDLWATRCGPCIGEFGYKDDLMRFLKSQNIEILYVSLDRIDAINTWGSFIKKYKLKGTHYFANDKFSKNLSDILKEPNFGIPRYLVFDANGKMVLSKAKRPSDGQLLYDQIIDALK